MNKYTYVTALTLTTLSVASCTDAGTSAITPVPFNQVTLHGDFWGGRMETEISTTIPFSLDHCAPAIGRFEKCVAYVEGRSQELPSPHRFISSDMYKVLEGAAYSLMISPNPETEAKIDYIADLIGRAQRPDGYLYISHICGNPHPGEMGTRPYSYVIHSHELYNVGHLYEAAVAYYQATGKDNLLKIAEKSARHVNRVFFEGDPAYNDGKPVNQAPGHEEIELALCKLYRCTGDTLYLNMAKRFLDIRGITFIPDGEGVNTPEYAQQHAPVALQTKPVGHAVRAGYLYTGMAQVDALTGRHDYAAALDSIWTNLVSTKMHITGGLGAVAAVEGFGEEYELPNRDAYDETCAAVANVFFNEGMFLASGDARYLDVAEVSIFNNALAGINLRGDRFFYVNPLETDEEYWSGDGAKGRSEWFGCACCPPNISRLIMQMPGYMYAYSDDAIYVTLYSSSSTSVTVNGTETGISQKSEYPYDGRTAITLNPARESRFSLKLRIPAWAESGIFVPGGLYTFTDDNTPKIELLVNGEPARYTMEKGFATVTRRWKPGDLIELNLPMPVRHVRCDERVEDNSGCLAVTRGPLVYCAEGVDNQNINAIRLNAYESSVIAPATEGILKDIPVITTAGGASLIPYFAWANRGEAPVMRVWLYEDCREKIESAVRNHLALYPQARLQDLYKAFFQAEFGAEHIVSDTTSAGRYLDYELTEPDTLSVFYEPIGADSSYFRVHLKCVQKGYITRDELFHAFLGGVHEVTIPHIEAWKDKWGYIESVISAMGLDLPDYDADSSEIDSLLAGGHYAVHHSDVFTGTYHPHYRIIRRDLFYGEILNDKMKTAE